MAGEMIDRVASDLFAWEHQANMFRQWQTESEVTRNAFRAKARVAMKAMREPTAWMEDGNDGRFRGTCAVATFQTMIDAALDERS